MSTTVYETACQSWRGSELGGNITTIQLANGTVLGRFPLGFLLTGGQHVRKKSYLHTVAKLLACIPDGVPSDLTHEAFSEDDEDAEVRAGSYIFVPSMQPKKAVGPQGKSKSRSHQDVDDPSTVSHSSRSSANQSRFRLYVLFRDGRCLASQSQDPRAVTAAHIVPVSLGQDYLDGITRIPNTVGLYSVTNGLTLRKDLHSTFDSYEWGIFVVEGLHTIHVFGDSNHDLHGQVIDYSRSNASQLPNAELLMWHYKQCLLARIRGFYVSPAEDRDFVSSIMLA